MSTRETLKLADRYCVQWFYRYPTRRIDLQGDLDGAKHGEIGRILENGCGFTVTPGDGEALTERILALAGDRDLCASMGARARMAFERQWDKEQALAEWDALLQTVLARPMMRRGAGLNPNQDGGSLSKNART